MDERDFPPEVSAAVGRLRLGAGDERDRSALVNYLVQNGSALDGATLTELSDLIQGPTQSVPTTAETGFANTNPDFTYQPGGGDIRSQAAAAAAAPANLPTPAPPPVTATSTQIPLSPNDPSMRGGSPQTLASAPNVASVRAPGGPNTSMPPISALDAAPGGVGASNIQRRVARQSERAQAQRPGTTGRTNWKGIEGLGTDSAFSDISPQYLEAIASNPELAAQELAGPGHSITGKAMEPLMGSALNMASLGLLGGTHGHRLGAPDQMSSSQKLARAEQLVSSLGPGESIRPGYVMRKVIKRAGNTPVGDLQTGQGDANDIMQQVAVTQDAILGPLKGVATEDAYNGTATMLNQEANAWLMAVDGCS